MHRVRPDHNHSLEDDIDHGGGDYVDADDTLGVDLGLQSRVAKTCQSYQPAGANFGGKGGDFMEK